MSRKIANDAIATSRQHIGMASLCRFAAIAALVFHAATASAQSLPRFGAAASNVKVELVAATDAVVPGQPLQVGLKLVHDNGWHTYWQVPGDSGLPTQINWQLPPGFVAGPIEWPHPLRLPLGPLMNFGYKADTLLLTTVSTPSDVTTAVTLNAKVEWLECKDVCIPGSADLALTLPVRAAAKPSPSARLFASARALVPQPMPGLTAQGAIDGDRIRLGLATPPDRRIDRIEFFPLEEARIEPAAKQPLRHEEGRAVIYLTAAKPVSPEFNRLKGVVVANGGPAFPQGWTSTVDVPLAAGAVAAVTASAADSATPSMSWLGALAFAFVGGLILNLMPCVFPVLSLKLLGLARHRSQADSMAAQGIAFALGVVLSFLVLASLLIGLQQAGSALGWGFQLQVPWVVSALTTLFFVIGLNLLGVFEFTFGQGAASSGVANAVAGQSGWRGSFGTGALAVVAASACTAPFMGAALGYAITQPAAVALSVFAALGVGMATPYLLLTLFPRWLAKLPRPGRWMELFKQSMAFPMFATCVWLLWVLAQQVDAGGVALTLGVLVAAGFALWALGLSQRGQGAFRWVALAGAVGAALTFAPIADSGSAVSRGTPDAGGWMEYSPQALAQFRSEGKAVFIDFTAAWCVTCQVNKRTVLNTQRVRDRFVADNVLLMRADWTNRDERITKALAEFGRNGVPLYVLYDRAGQPTVLPEILTENIVMTALDNIK